MIGPPAVIINPNRARTHSTWNDDVWNDGLLTIA